jgi:hypothetical protein
VPATALVLALSSTVVLPRVLLLAALVAPGVLVGLAPPLLAMLAVLLALSAVTYLLTRSELAAVELDHAPSDLRAAVAFGLLYAAVLLGVAAARHWLREGGLYAVAALSGLTDVDAIALATVQLVRVGRVEVEIGWRLVLVGVMANLVFKGAAAIALGHPQIRRWVLALFGTALVGGAGLLLIWPGSGSKRSGQDTRGRGAQIAASVAPISIRLSGGLLSRRSCSASRARSASETMPTSAPRSSTTGRRRTWASRITYSASAALASAAQVRTGVAIASRTRSSESGFPVR